MPSRLASIRKRTEALVLAAAVAIAPFNINEVCFPRQAEFVQSDKRFSTAVSTRRSGKTVGISAKLFRVAREKPGCVCLYITKSRINAKRLFWKILKTMNEAYGLGGVVSESELAIRLPNASEIYLSGCVHEAEIENFRGMPIGIVVLDEAQSFPSFIESLIDEVLAPALMDFDGQLALVGTPGPVPIGYFYDCATSAEWAHFSWSVFDNPHILKKSGKTPQALLDEELKRRGVTVDEASIQREWFGRWVLDVNALVFRYDAEKNHVDLSRLPRCANHVICIDVGFDDSDAIGVLGWNDDSPNLYLVEEMVMAKQTITPLMAQVQKLYEKYDPMGVVCDYGGLGKKIALEIQARTGIPVEAAEKSEKLAHIEQLNDSLRTVRFFAPKDSRFAQDCMKVEWDRTNPEKPKISERFHSDICDAVLYGWRKCQQWLFVAPEKPKATPGTVEHAIELQQEAQRQLDEQFEAALEANLQRQQEQQENEQWT